MAETKKPKKWVPKSKFKPGGTPGKLHRELGIKEGEKIPADRLRSAIHSSNPEVKRDAVRAETMKGWRHKKSPLYTHPRSKRS